MCANVTHEESGLGFVDPGKHRIRRNRKPVPGHTSISSCRGPCSEVGEQVILKSECYQTERPHIGSMPTINNECLQGSAQLGEEQTFGLG